MEIGPGLSECTRLGTSNSITAVNHTLSNTFRSSVGNTGTMAGPFIYSAQSVGTERSGMEEAMMNRKIAVAQYEIEIDERTLLHREARVQQVCHR